MQPSVYKSASLADVGEQVVTHGGEILAAQAESKVEDLVRAADTLSAAALGDAAGGERLAGQRQHQADVAAHLAGVQGGVKVAKLDGAVAAAVEAVQVETLVARAAVVVAVLFGH